MAKLNRTSIQNYPRIEDEASVYNGFFDDSKVQQHVKELNDEEINAIIIKAVKSANLKSSRAILNIKDNVTENEINKIYKKHGRELFNYFVKYCGDPAATAFDCIDQHYAKIAKEQFRNRTLQKERMNSGWRYQFIAKDAALLTQRFNSISDIGASEADFNATILEIKNDRPINIYVSVKNRTNTMGGQDWPKAIRAMESMALSDKNRTGPYLCVFGIAMDKGLRNIRNEGKTGMPYSINTEVWLSDFFWPFFTNCSYEKIIKSVFNVLKMQGGKVV